MCDNTRFLQLIDAQIREREAQEANRGWQAFILAADLPTYRALMRGETVPAENLRPDAKRRFGLRWPR